MKYIILTLALSTTLLFGATSKQDDKTGLIWQDNKVVSQNKMKYNQAIKYCENLKLDGFENWHLPSLKELVTILDFKKDMPTIKNGFNIRISDYFWSSIVDAKEPKNSAWRVSFSYGEIESYPQSRKYYVRCVTTK